MSTTWYYNTHKTLFHKTGSCYLTFSGLFLQKHSITGLYISYNTYKTIQISKNTYLAGAPLIPLYPVPYERVKMHSLP